MCMTIYFLYDYGIWQCQLANLQGYRLVNKDDVNVSSINKGSGVNSGDF